MTDSKTSLGELQLAIMRVLWDQGEASAAEVHRALHERGLAPTTISTMLRKMEEKGVVRHRSLGRVFLYRAAVDSEHVHRSMVGELVDRLFQGDPRELVGHLLREGDIDLAEIEALRRELDERARRSKGSGSDAGPNQQSDGPSEQEKPA